MPTKLLPYLDLNKSLCVTKRKAPSCDARQVRRPSQREADPPWLSLWWTRCNSHFGESNGKSVGSMNQYHVRKPLETKCHLKNIFLSDSWVKSLRFYSLFFFSEQHNSTLFFRLQTKPVVSTAQKPKGSATASPSTPCPSSRGPTASRGWTAWCGWTCPKARKNMKPTGVGPRSGALANWGKIGLWRDEFEHWWCWMMVLKSWRSFFFFQNSVFYFFAWWHGRTKTSACRNPS